MFSFSLAIAARFQNFMVCQRNCFAVSWWWFSFSFRSCFNCKNQASVNCFIATFISRFFINGLGRGSFQSKMHSSYLLILRWYFSSNHFFNYWIKKNFLRAVHDEVDLLVFWGFFLKIWGHGLTWWNWTWAQTSWPRYQMTSDPWKSLKFLFFPIMP